MKKAYYYFFYKIYKAIKYTSVPFGNFLISFKAGLVLIVLQIWSFLSIINYYTFFTGNPVELSISKPIVYVTLIFIIGFNYYTLDYLDIWKKYIQEFDQLPKKKNVIGSWIAILITLMLIINFIFSFYCLDQRARKDQIGPYAPEIVAKERKEDSLQKTQQIERLKKIYGEDQK
ncbi:hypothetical protein [Chryseobacterium shandongense]|uniref:hypothetical protein n=2 Tax=Chryseobacterium shandongense TaxID=1493872 RepID=UPI000F4D7495|nr:hypothetical protein [Chryseobacterium shandongense]AZA58190.1 hypothetical protein EG350_13790 [Chryseobacterium shandongense]